MESPRNLHDCYFYYYSTCRKGKSCTFRHCPEALGHEESCPLFLQGKCFNQNCKMRHMKIQKPRSTIQCYWELQAAGCLKPHCVFQHRKSSVVQNVPPPQVIPAGMLQQIQPGAGGVLLLPRIL